MAASRIGIVPRFYPPGGLDFVALVGDPEVEAGMRAVAEPVLHPEFDLGETILVHAQIRARSKTVGVELTMNGAAAYRFEGEKVRSLTDYPHFDDALRVLGMTRGDLPAAHPPS